MPLVAAGLGIAAMWINYGCFPIELQLRIGVLCVIVGSWVGSAARRSRAALACAVVVVVGLFVWGTSTGISDDLYGAARTTGRYILAIEGEIPDRDEGLRTTLREFFRVASENSRRDDPVMANRAAILALGVVLGDERIADVARREIDLHRVREAEVLRDRISVRGTQGLVAALLGQRRPHGLERRGPDHGRRLDQGDHGRDTGREWLLLRRPRSGSRGQSLRSGRDSRRGVRAGDAAAILAGARLDDFFPALHDVQENLSQNDLHTSYGGLGGEGTRKVVEEIRRRLAKCAGLR
ncbi:MAG: hypothetical protein CMJ83_10435 [Planctomycetes bacterium]|nr:hypothetical protein [Planctomycetota bacterium]